MANHPCKRASDLISRKPIERSNRIAFLLPTSEFNCPKHFQ